MFYDGAWNTVSAQDLDASRSSIGVTFGMQDSHSEAVPTEVGLTLESPGSKWAPLDPRSPVHAKVGVGSPLRVRIGNPQVGLSLLGMNGTYASTPDTAVLDITGDIDVRVELEPVTWRPTYLTVLVAKVDAQFSYGFFLAGNGNLLLVWTTDGTTGTLVSVVSTAPVSASAGRLAVRATLDVNNGAGGKTVTFYTASAIGGSWTQLGAAVTTAGTTSIFASTVDLAVGASSLGGTVFAP
ncbi:MAG TPA: hypothetical protein VET29_09795, partial [Actinophytocola sp.]